MCDDDDDVVSRTPYSRAHFYILLEFCLYQSQQARQFCGEVVNASKAVQLTVIAVSDCP